MFMAGILQRGPRGLDLRPPPVLDEDIGDINQYGVDWAAHGDGRLMRHLIEHNPEEQNTQNTFRSMPEHMARAVECNPPNCPFSNDEMDILRVELADRVAAHIHRRNMPSRRIVWHEAIVITSEMRPQRTTA
jgi:hypothetical protein